MDACHRAAVDTAVLNALTKQLAAAGDDLRRELLCSYLEQGRLQIPELQSAAEDGEPATVRRIAHSLRSSSALLGALPLAELLANAENAVRNGNNDLIPIATSIVTEYARVQKAMTSMVEESPLLS
jgi:two-component system sensor histidine kinase/response regulator